MKPRHGIFLNHETIRISVAALALIAWMMVHGFGSAMASSSLDPFVYRYTGRTANGDSSINAWFHFPTSAMSDRLVFFYEIPLHSLEISGDFTAANGQYNRFLGGGISFHDTVPGPQNLPSFHSLVVQNTASSYMVQANSFGDPALFIGDPVGTGRIFSGEWSFEVVPEPATISLVLLGAATVGMWSRRRGERAEA